MSPTHYLTEMRDLGPYRGCLASVCELLSARAATLFIEDRGAPQTVPQLLHTDVAAPVPELENPAVASEHVGRLTAGLIDHALRSVQIFPSTSTAAMLLRITPFTADPSALNPEPRIERRAVFTEGDQKITAPAVWIGLVFDSETDIEKLRHAIDIEPAPQPMDAARLGHTLTLLAAVMWDNHQYRRLLQDPTSQLPGRAEFQARLKMTFEVASDTGQSLGLLLINPDGFGAINERLGRENGDRAVAEVASLLRGSLRQDEKIFRYGGAVFAILMPAADANSLEVVARKIRQSLSGAYLDGAVRLMFSAGAAVFDPEDEEDGELDDLGLLRRADHALNLAKRAGGGCSVLWKAEQSGGVDTGVDRLSGIFTANTEKDYRNMLLLWDTVALLSASTRRPEIVRQFVERIKLSLKPTRVELLERSDGGRFRPLADVWPEVHGNAPRFKLDNARQALLHQAHVTLKSGRGEFTGEDPAEAGPVDVICHAIPVPANGECLACLYIEGPASRIQLDSSDIVFLDGLAGQLGLALDRVALAERVQQEAESESRRLREEVQDLRQALNSAKLVYSSQQMHAVLDTVRAVAETDVTILIDGESGTGKEMLARAAHELSERRDKPLVVVDCGAIAHNLIEAELFGHVKGAYTGAQGSSLGRIAQAEGGTLFLDEIGELPLDVQAKLLRFVQEKEISQVGSTTSRKVDTRIVAATNRDLGREAAAGRFREDLYYRLKVVTVTAPPLRDRPDDILPLAKHFLDKFALQYEKPVRRFEPEAEMHIQNFTWPGNVRELQNCILRAVVLCTGDAISSELLQLDEKRPETTPVPPSFDLDAHEGPASEGEIAAFTSDPWSALNEELAVQVTAALTDTTAEAVPLGRWLTEDIVGEADQQARGNARRAAAGLGIAETTFRRQLKKMRSAEAQGLRLRSSSWSELYRVLTAVVRASSNESGDTVDRAKNLLLHHVAVNVAGKDSLGAALMGVTVPTYRRWREEAAPELLMAAKNDDLRVLQSGTHG